MNTIVIPALIVAAIGLIAAIILTVASKLMYVPVDERVEAITEALPGANCGACGFAGCADYASAIVNNPGQAVNSCTVGGAAVAAEIAKIMGVEAGSMEAKVAKVMCNGNYEATDRIEELARIHTCKSAKMFYSGGWACPYGCLGMGDCVDVCKFDAIHVVNGVAKVDQDKCVGCEACSKVCPNGVISIVSAKQKVFVECKSIAKGGAARKACSNACIGCKKCEKSCKFDAVHVIDNLAQIDYDKCKNCGLCAKECPTGAIVNLRKKKAPAKKPAEPAAKEA